MGMLQDNGAPWDLLEMLQFLRLYHEAYRQLYKAFTIAATLSITSASNERSFSSLKLIKTYLRSTMEDEMLGDLVCLSINREMTSRLDMEDFIEKFKGKAGRIEL